MKIKNYESISFLYTVIFVISIVFFILLFFSTRKNIRTYKVIMSTVMKNDIVEVLVTDKELKTIYNNKYLFIDKRKKKIKIEKIDKKVLKRSNKYYHSVIFKVELNKRVKENDTKKLLFFDEKVTFFDMMKVIWKGV